MPPELIREYCVLDEASKNLLNFEMEIRGDIKQLGGVFVCSN